MDDIRIFDRSRLKILRDRKARKLHEHDFLFRWAADRIAERLEDIKRDFPITLQIGGRVGNIHWSDKIGDLFTMDHAPAFLKNDGHAVCADEEFFPFKPGSLDLIISNMNAHTVNDLPGALLQFKQSLKADGLFIGAMFGGETLHELRDSLMQAEMTLKNGVSPRVFPFADKQQMGALMQRAGFALPVVDSEILTVTYADMFALLKDLRGMGEMNVIEKRDKQYPGRELFMNAANHYAHNHAEDGRIIASFEIIFLIGWSPHASQQQPLKPGSATKSLAEALETQEFKTQDKAAP